MIRCLQLEALEVRAVPNAMPVVAIVATDAIASEGENDPATFTVTRTGGKFNQPLTVRYFVGSASSASSADYAPLTGKVVIPAGQASATIGIVPVDDDAIEGDETLRLQVRPMKWYSIAASQAHADVAIKDDDDAPQVLAPVLMVIANRDFYYQEYSHTRTELTALGLSVVVGAQAAIASYPHANSGQGGGDGMVMPDIALHDADAEDYSAIVFVGGWGASMYQYAFTGTYANSNYNGTLDTEAAVNRLVTELLDMDKYVTAICHGVSALAWARVDGVSPIAGKTVSAYALSAPSFQWPDGSWSNALQQTTRWHVESNGATMVPSRSIGDPATAADDVIVDGRIITAENFDSARLFGQTIAAALMG